MTIADSLNQLKMQMHMERQNEFLMIGRSTSIDHGEMNKLCRQVSIESPNLMSKDCVYNAIVPVADCPPHGARILVVYAGACYRKTRDTSCTSISSMSSDLTRELSDISITAATLQQMQASGSFGRLDQMGQSSPSNCGFRDAALFPGFEVAGVIETLGSEVGEDCGFKVGQRVILYPYEGLPAGYSELFVVPELKYLVPIPDTLELSIAAMLPTGALLAMSSILSAHKIVDNLKAKRGETTPIKILIVGTGGLALWAVRIAAQHFYTKESREKSRIELTVACLRDEGLELAKSEFEKVNIVQWSEDLYEKQLIERTQNACKGLVDIVIDFGTTSRSLHRSLQCLNEGGVVLISDEVAEKLLPKFSRKAEERKQHIEPVPTGTIEQLYDLVKLVANKDIIPPPHSVFPCEEAAEVIRKLVNSEIPGRAILKFHDIE
ncbi:CLUMA_CG005713, isoform A [Clunio marinus]|uniref:CLUMA_CG005713, isoform A n=1 Tax=Clunio marinus TaxID=568069 RepID=A0A1J1HW64_9DIPT|nr:CLUMA_CG005713, isoform A [Clunio marinus]